MVHLENSTCYGKWSLSCFQSSPLRSTSAKWLHSNSGLQEFFLPMGSQSCTMLGCLWSLLPLAWQSSLPCAQPAARGRVGSLQVLLCVWPPLPLIGGNNQTALRKCYWFEEPLQSTLMLTFRKYLCCPVGRRIMGFFYWLSFRAVIPVFEEYWTVRPEYWGCVSSAKTSSKQAK